MRRKFLIQIVTMLLLALTSLSGVAAQEEAITTYIVREGNTLEQIAAFFNVELDCIAGDNNLLGAEELTAGRELIIASDCPPYVAPVMEAADDTASPETETEVEAATDDAEEPAEAESAPDEEADAEPAMEATDEPEPAPTPEDQGGGSTPAEVSAPQTEQASGTLTPLGTDRMYTVVRGDRLAILARDYGVAVRCLIIANNIYNPDLIYVGQSLFIPRDCDVYDQGGSGVIPTGTPAGGNTVILRTQTGFKEYTIQPDGTYLVRPGDMLDFIGLAFNLDTQCLAAANQLVNPGLLRPNQRLLIDRSCPAWYGPRGPVSPSGEAVG